MIRNLSEAFIVKEEKSMERPFNRSKSISHIPDSHQTVSPTEKKLAILASFENINPLKLESIASFYPPLDNTSLPLYE